MSDVPTPFKVRESRLTDNSVVWEVYQNGSGQRLASTEDETEARDIVDVLNTIMELWAAYKAGNSIDC
jgi:hypothetical protein